MKEKKIQSMVNTMDRKNNEVKAHYANDCGSISNECNYGEHEAFFFLEDVSSHYESSAENKVYYRCACLNCGRIDVYQMSRFNRRLTVYPCLDTIFSNEFYKVRKKYLDLQDKHIEKETAIAILNEEYRKKEHAESETQFAKIYKKPRL